MIDAAAIASRDSTLTDNDNKQNSTITIASSSESISPVLVRTKTTDDNLTLIASALCIDPNPPPILLCGPNGSGKSTLIREVARMMSSSSFGRNRHHHNSNDDNFLLEIHVDDETDTKTLIGSYTATDIPGEFEWRPGALTNAVRAGKWVLIEDLDTVSYEIQASLLGLFTDRLLPLGNGQTEKCHPNFRLFATITNGNRVRRPLHPHVWYEVPIEPVPINELNEIVTKLYPRLPQTVIESVIQIFHVLDQSGRIHDSSINISPTGDTTLDIRDAVPGNTDNNSTIGNVDGNEKRRNESTTRSSPLFIGRNPSVRDFFKVLSRIQYGIPFEMGTTFITESQRTLCLAECYDIFAAACSDCDVRRQFIKAVAAPAWNVTSILAVRYIETRCPTITLHTSQTELGRVRIHVDYDDDCHTMPARTVSNNFAQTNYSLRFMESIGVCVRENEPTLLVGETGRL